MMQGGADLAFNQRYNFDSTKHIQVHSRSKRETYTDAQHHLNETGASSFSSLLRAPLKLLTGANCYLWGNMAYYLMAGRLPLSKTPHVANND